MTEIPYILGIDDNIVPINQSNIDLAAFRLLSIFLSDKNYIGLMDKNKNEPNFIFIDTLIGDLKYDQVIHLLIEIATLYRSLDNKLPVVGDYKKIRKERIVGLLYEPRGSKKQNLTMREACNKIIHADKINYDIRKLPKSERYYLTPKIYLNGEKNKKAWKAILDIVKFCEYSFIPLQYELMVKSKPELVEF